MLKNMKLGTKILVGFIIVAIVTLFVGGVGLYGTMNLSSDLNEVGGNRLPSIQALLTISEAQTAVDSSENALLTPELDQAGRTKQYDRIKGALERADKAWKIYEPLPQSKEEAKEWAIFIPAWEKWKKDDADFINLSKAAEANKADLELRKKVVEQALVTNGISFSAAETSLNNIIKINEDIALESKANSDKDIKLITTLSLVGMILGTILAVIIGLIIASSITKPVTRIVAKISEGADQVAAASGQLSSASQKLAEGASEQASALEETSSTLNESSSMIQQNTQNTKQAAMLSEKVKDSADKGNTEMKEMSGAMDELKKSSGEISKIIKVIDDIAFQTNILALNAAVEAARAGEAGMGFAVVAEEVRNLAQRSAQAAKDTSAIIEKNISLSERGVSVSKRVADSLGEITVQAKKVNELMDEITAASQEQTQGIDQINRAVSQMEQVTQGSASTAEESAAASEELSAQAMNMKEVISELTRMVYGADRQGSTPMSYSHESHHEEAPRRIVSLKQVPSALRSGTTNSNRVVKNSTIVRPEHVIPLEEDLKGF